MLNVKDFGAVGDGKVDDLAAFQSAIEALNTDPLSPMGGAIYVPPGVYRLSSTLVLNRAINLFGDLGGWFAASVLKFDAAASPGILVYRDDGGAIPSRRADWSLIEKLEIRGAGIGNSPPGAHGIMVNARCTIRSVYVDRFGGDGVHIFASVTGTPRCTASSGCIDDLRVDGCGGNGVFLGGSDANRWKIRADIGDCGGWGVYDHSFLGNSIGDCLTANCALGSYNVDDVNASSSLKDAYSEKDGHQNCNFAGGTSIGFGNGNVQVPPHCAALSVALGQGVAAFLNGAAAMDSIGYTFGKTLSPVTFFGSQVTGGTYLELCTFAEGVLAGQRYRLITQPSYNPWDGTLPYPRWYCWNYAGLSTGTSFSICDSNAVEYLEGFVGTKCAADHGIYLGHGRPGEAGSTRILETTFASMPTSGTWYRGDRVYNTMPSAGGPEGWVCVQSGSDKTTPAVFKTFGLIGM